tara:strand:- start:29461 stop:29769 length:309 start_codon:yes stop_codon:yes gene_type:complete
MRQIKFRAWHREAKEYCCGCESNMFSWIDDGQPITLEQFTGLQDKNGVDIYESMEIDGTHNVKFKNGSYVLIDISSGDIVLLHTYIESRSGNVKITREYTEI